MTDTMAVESFIDFCNDMKIEPAQEGMFQTIKNKIVDVFLKLVKAIEGFVKKRKDSKFKSILMGLLKRARTGLEKAKGIKEGDTTEALEEEAKTIKDQFDQVQNAANEVDRLANDTPGEEMIEEKRDAKQDYYMKSYNLIKKIYENRPDLFDYEIRSSSMGRRGSSNKIPIIEECFFLHEDDETYRIGAKLGLHASSFVFKWDENKTRIIMGPSRI